MQPSPKIMDLVARLGPILGPRLRTDAAALAQVACDASHVPAGQASAWALPETTAEVSALAKHAQELGVALVPRGAGTGKVGGCVPGEGQVVVDLSRMNRIIAMAPADGYAVVQPGVTPLALDEAARAVGMMYPPDPASWDRCSLGGTIATNAGGPRAVKYGVTGRYVWGLEVVLAGGDVLRLGRRSLKGVVGLDLVPLFVGSEGTLGLITEATMHLIPARAGLAGAWIVLPSVAAAVTAAAGILAHTVEPCMLELLDAPALAAVRATGQWQVPAGDVALWVQADGADAAQASQALEAFVAAAGGVAHVVTARAAIAHYDGARRAASSALKQAYPFKVSDDLAVPRSHMGALYAEAQAVALAHGLRACAYGHLGDGNLHINWLCKTPEERARTPQARTALYTFAIAHGGTLSGEHGIGLSKQSALALEFSPDRMALERRIKAAFDPRNIMNPGKVWPNP